MTDELKEQIILQIIKDYKNRSEWTDDYVKEKYDVVIQYMTENYDKLTKISKDASIQSKMQGSRSVTYKAEINSIIQSDFILRSLLGLPLMRCY